MKTKEKYKTFEEMAADEPGTIYHDEIRDGIRFIIMRGPASLTAYLGVPLDHPLAGFGGEAIPVFAHYGFTFGGFGDQWRPEDRYWYGWDYAHSGDVCFYNLKRGWGPVSTDDKKWTVSDVLKDEHGTIYEFTKLARLAEQIQSRSRVG